MLHSQTAAGAPAPVRTSSRPAATYQEYVISYVREQRRNVLLAFGGISLCVGAIMYTHGAPLVMLCAMGLGMASAGLAALAIAADAHAKYTAHLATTHTTIYNAPEPATASVRAFVPSVNGTQTIRAGKFRLDRTQWVKLFQTATDGGKLTRDNAMRALPRPMYREWQSTLEELARLGIVDDDGIITPAGWQWYSDTISPYSDEAGTPSGAHSTHARRTHGRTDAHGAGVAL